MSSNQKDCVYSVFYEINLRRELDHTEHNTDQPALEESYKSVLSDEVLSYSYEFEGKKIRLSPVIDTRTAEDVVFLPASKYQTIIGRDKEALTSLLVAKQLARTTSRSFIFSRELLNMTRQNCKDDGYRFLIESLVYFGNFHLFVINTTNAGLISMNGIATCP